MKTFTPWSFLLNRHSYLITQPQFKVHLLAFSSFQLYHTAFKSRRTVVVCQLSHWWICWHVSSVAVRISSLPLLGLLVHAGLKFDWEKFQPLWKAGWYGWKPWKKIISIPWLGIIFSKVKNQFWCLRYSWVYMHCFSGKRVYPWGLTSIMIAFSSS